LKIFDREDFLERRFTLKTQIKKESAKISISLRPK